MEEYEFNGYWSSSNDSPPSTSTRCLVTDGDVIFIATYIADSVPVWVIQGLDKAEEFKVVGWMPLPKPINKKIEVI